MACPLKRPAALLDGDEAADTCGPAAKRLRLAGWADADAQKLLASLSQRRVPFVSAGILQAAASDSASPVPTSPSPSSRATPDLLSGSASPAKRALKTLQVLSARNSDAFTLRLPASRYARVRHMATNGSFGSLFQSEDTRTGGDVVIKRQSTHDNMSCESAYRELRCLLHLTTAAPNPYIVSLEDCWWDEGHLYIVEPRLSCDLAVWMRRMADAGRDITPTMRAALAEATYSAIQHLHDCNVLHRDLKPENICVSADLSAIKLIDLGSCRRPLEREYHGRYSLHTFGRYVCTYPYRAPEIVQDATEYDGKVDVWSLGCIVAELVLGAPLFRCKEKDLAAQHSLFVPSVGCLRQRVPAATPRELQLLAVSLQHDAAKRATAGAAIAEFTKADTRPVPEVSGNAVKFYPPHYDYDNLQEIKDHMMATVAAFEKITHGNTAPEAHSPQLKDRIPTFPADNACELHREGTSTTNAVTDEAPSLTGSPCSRLG